MNVGINSMEVVLIKNIKNRLAPGSGPDIFKVIYNPLSSGHATIVTNNLPGALGQ